MKECSRCNKKTYGYDAIKWHPDLKAFFDAQGFDLLCSYCQGELHWEFFNAKAKAAAAQPASSSDSTGSLAGAE